MKKETIMFALAAFFIGLMVSIHLSIEEEKPKRDTRDLWEIRTALLEEQERQKALQDELNQLKNIRTDYEDNLFVNQLQTLQDQIQSLQQEAGLTEMSGQGIELTLTPNYQVAEENEGFPELTAELLNRLINELNVYGSKFIAVDNERIVSHTPIRDVVGRVYVNQRPLRDLPVIIYILTDDPETLINYMEVSQSLNDLAIHNISLEIKESQSVTIPRYSGDMTLNYVNVLDYEEEGEE